MSDRHEQDIVDLPVSADVYSCARSFVAITCDVINILNQLWCKGIGIRA